MDRYDIFSYINIVLSIIGYYGIFKKFGVNPNWTFVPFARGYKLSLCADREKDGRIFAVSAGIVFFLDLIGDLIPEAFLTSHRAMVYFIFVILLTLGIVKTIFEVRVLIGLFHTFGIKKKWLVALLFIVGDGIILAVLAFDKRFQPLKKADELYAGTGAKIADIDVSHKEDGLTVNIRERTAVEFFRKKYLLRDIHLSIPKGRMVLLLGGSGAGKTTFVNAVTGYEQADASIILGDKDIYKEYKKMKYDVGFVPQQDLIRGNDTVMLTLSDAAALRLPAGFDPGMRRERVSGVLEEFGLNALRSSLVEKLSGGQRKRLSIAMEFVSDPTLFILDEPDSGLDGVVARGLFEKLRAIADRGKIVIVITHTPDRVIDLFDDVIVLAKDEARTGRLAYYGPVKEAYGFFEKDSMEEILLSINQKDEGGEGRANEFVEKYGEKIANINREDSDRKAG